MRVLVDTNVVLDVLMAREPHLDQAMAAFMLDVHTERGYRDSFCDFWDTVQPLDS